MQLNLRENFFVTNYKKMNSTLNQVCVKLSKLFINAIPQERHFQVLKELHRIDDIVDFPATIRDLIKLNQMEVFGISNEMQVVLKYINHLEMLNNITEIRKSFQEEYEKFHKRTVVIVQSGINEKISVSQIIQSISNKFDTNSDIIFQITQHKGIALHFQNQQMEYQKAA
jgi:hypothetical protein